MNFITIDFETATSDRYSPCEIGLTFVEDNVIKETKSWLIRPPENEYDEFNMYIHGITPEYTKDSPNFDEIWKTIKPEIDGKFLIAHCAGFDLSVLRSTLNYYNLDFPNINYACSYIFSKQVWKGLPSYGLDDLCKLNGIKFKHHRAGNDSKATAELSLAAFKEANVKSFDDFKNTFKISIGELCNSGTYSPCRTKHTYIRKVIPIIADNSKNQPDNLFYEQSVVFTGKLMSMERRKAQQIIADIGGINSKSVTKDTNYLVVGQQDYRIVGDDGMSSKQERAIKLLEQGCAIEILSEDDFLRNI